MFTAGYCIRFLLLLPALLPTVALMAEDAPPGGVRVEAQTLGGDDDTVRAVGEVRACFGRYTLQTRALEYERRGGVLRTPAFQLHGLDGEVSGDSLRYDVAARRGEVENLDVTIGKKGLRAVGKKALLQGDSYEAEEVKISSCKGTERDWSLRAESMSHRDQITEARHLWFYLREAPVLYLPWFAINSSDERRSGFLWPDVKYGHDDGAKISAPYYWALADNYDATLTPHWLSSRGLLLDGEFRYLTTAHAGEVLAGWTPLKRETRARQYFKHVWRHGDWRVEVSADNVSDDAYFADFSDDAVLLAKRNLPRRLAVEYERGGWRGRLAAESFKTLNYNGAPPHDLLPQLQLRHDGARGDYQWYGEWEYAKFVANRSGQEENGRWLWRGGAVRRFALGGGAVYPEVGAHAVKYNGGAAFLTPYLRLRMESGYRPLPSVTAASYQLQAAYALAPETNQRNAPLFDTELRELSAGGIYEWNRFSGGDRAADVHVFAYGADVRWWDAAANREQAAVEIAQRYYLRRPRLTLPDEGAPPEQGFANLFATLRARLDNRWKAEADAEWNPGTDKWESVYADFRADFGGRRRLRLGAAFDQGESVTWGGTLPLGGRLEAALLAHHLLDDDIAEYRAALVLRAACGCWRLSVGTKNLIIGQNKTKQSYSIGLEFKGLGTVSSDIYEKIAAELR